MERSDGGGVGIGEGLGGSGEASLGGSGGGEGQGELWGEEGAQPCGEGKFLISKNYLIL